MKIKVKCFDGVKRLVQVTDRSCPSRKCFHPHDCPVQGGSGVRESKSRWVCLTNFLHGCPDIQEKEERIR